VEVGKTNYNNNLYVHHNLWLAMHCWLKARSILAWFKLDL